MARTSVSLALVLLATAVTVEAREPSPAPAQEAQPQPPSTPPSRLTPLKVQLVVTRTKDDKKISSLPYVLWVTANDRQPTNLRMGVELPVSTTAINGGLPVPSFSYRPIGTNIDCTATTVDSGFNLNITLSDSSIQFDPKDAAGPSSRLADAPAFRSFTSKFSILLRDGQTAEYTSATDPVSGEMLKVSVTLNVLK